MGLSPTSKWCETPKEGITFMGVGSNEFYDWIIYLIQDKYSKVLNHYYLFIYNFVLLRNHDLIPNDHPKT